MASKVLHLGAPKDGEAPDKVLLTFRTVNQGEELRARLKLEIDRMAAEKTPGQLSVVGRFAR